MVHKPTTITISVIAAVAVAGTTMSVLAAISSANQAFAQAKATSLSLAAYPQSGRYPVRVSFSGQLTSEGSGVGGATIQITVTGEEDMKIGAPTNETGGYWGYVEVNQGTHKIEAYFPGDSTHTSSSATKTIQVPG